MTTSSTAEQELWRKQVGRGFKLALLNQLEFEVGKDITSATNTDLYRALAASVRDLLAERWLHSQQLQSRVRAKEVCYLSMEFLAGRTLLNALINLGLNEVCREVLQELGIELDALLECEEDPGLGNGGLGRLAACFLDSMATLELPSYGYGIRYQYGIFRQNLVDGAQVETPDNWLQQGNPWEFPRPQRRYRISYYGTVLHQEERVIWSGTEDVIAVAYDTVIPGFATDVVSTMRLWSAQAPEGFALDRFNDGDYFGAVRRQVRSEDISRVLYPADHTSEGRSLRLRQEYFLASATVQDVLARFQEHHGDDYRLLPEKAALQLNDTHPVLAIVELLRILVDQHGYQWEKAWQITRNCFGFTNHTVLPEALEQWPVAMLTEILPRHMELICQINEHFMAAAIGGLADLQQARSLSIVTDAQEPRVRMAYLGVVGSHSVNGVSQLHSTIVRDQLFAGFSQMWPEIFNNKTNGVTPRRWLLAANPQLSELITQAIGTDWPHNLEQLAGLRSFGDDTAFLERWHQVKLFKKRQLADHLAGMGVAAVDPQSLFDCQVKRIHEYKRQLLNALQLIHSYRRICDGDTAQMVPRTCFFAGKAAPSYHLAKEIIRLISGIAAAIANEPRCKGLLQVHFLPNYGVSMAEKLIPAADLSQQLSTAGTEASGTGNMKFALNGALTIGTLDGANIEMRERIGAEHFFLFGMDAAQVDALRQSGCQPQEVVALQPELQDVLALIASGCFGHGFDELLQALWRDDFLVLADFKDYLRAQDDVAQAWRNQAFWRRASLINCAAMGWFSSDRSVAQYAADIWQVKSVPLKRGGDACFSQGLCQLEKANGSCAQRRLILDGGGLSSFEACPRRR